MLSTTLWRMLYPTDQRDVAVEVANIELHRVGGWHNGEQVLKWTAVRFKEVKTRFRRVFGHRKLRLLRKNMLGETPSIGASEVANMRKTNGKCVTEIPHLMG